MFRRRDDLSDQYGQRDVVSLWPTVEEARDLDPIRPYADDDLGPQAMASPRWPSDPPNFKNHQFATPPVGRRISRTLFRFVFAVLIGVGCTLAWQSYGNDAKQMVRARAPSLAWLLPVSTTSGQGSAAAAVTSPELVQQLEPMAHNIAVVLFNLEQLAAKQEQLAAKQEQLAQNIAAFQAVEQDRQKPSSSPPSRTTAAPASKAAQPATQSSAAQSSAVRSSSALAAPAPRSPLPLR
jgi:hypothetical protein